MSQTVVPILIDGKTCYGVADGKGGFRILRDEPVKDGEAEETPAAKKANEEVESDESEDESDEDEVENDAPAAKKRKKGKAQQRCNWNEEEEEKLLDLCYEKNVPDKMDGKCGRLPHIKIFQSVCKPLNDAKLGNPKTAKQCKAKYKKLKALYFECVKKNMKSGNGRKECKNFDKLALLFSKRPRAVFHEWGQDSTTDLPSTSSAAEESATDTINVEKSVPTPPTTSTSSISSSPSSAANKLPKYRSMGNRSNPIVNVMNAFMEKSAEESKKQNEWFANQMNIQMATQKESVNTIAQSFQAGIASLVALLGNQSSMSNAHQATQPQAFNAMSNAHQATQPQAFNAMSNPPQATQPQAFNAFAQSTLREPVTPPVTPPAPKSTPVRPQSMATPARQSVTPPAPLSTPVRTHSSVLTSPTTSQIPPGTQLVKLPNGKYVLITSQNKGGGKSS